jgi:hypothetical protein
MERMATHASKKIRRFPCSLIADFCNKIGTKRTRLSRRLPSAYDPKADIRRIEMLLAPALGGLIE